eukprot:TRINITY_DN11434_c0_g1_i2.p1 TRINITY_DN11434_c0_g1~~TRINITY_DN11434_c0_g1_i2.p1  ORF type:complete len:479 (+),score=70.36 TRINITY_DN11434_c0_g1_i2:150-1586(+)
MGNEPTRPRRPRSRSVQKQPTTATTQKNTINEIQVLEGHTNIVRFLLKIDSVRFASASDDGAIIIWSYQTGEQIALLKQHTHPITCLLLLSQNILISGSADKTIRMWNLESYECFKVLSKHTGSVKCLATLDEDRFCSAGNDQSILIWQNDGELLASIERQEEENLNCLLPIMGHESGSRLVTGSNSSLLLVYRIDTLSFDKLLAYHRESVRCLVALPSFLFASGSLDGSIVVWQADSLAPLKILNYPDKYRDENRIFNYSVASLVPFSERYLIAAIGKGFRMYDIVSGDCIVESNDAHESDVLSIIPIDNEKFFHIATCSADSSVKIWNNKPVNQPFKFDAGSLRGIQQKTKFEAVCEGEMYVHSEMVNQLLFIDKGIFVSCGGDELVILWKDGVLQSETRNHYAVISLRQQVQQALSEKDENEQSYPVPENENVVDTLLHESNGKVNVADTLKAIDELESLTNAISESSRDYVEVQ